jgi:16S rRNA (adenine1518-N6/adenine1519-N6)-dimethyltransferase
MKLSEIKSHLADLSLHPSKSLGQNFLHDQNLAQWIVEQLELTEENHLVEIGPGLGALTQFAIPRCGSATLIEKDARLASFLEKQFANEKVEVRHQDALEFDSRTLFPRMPVKLLGNLPYYVTSPILFKFCAEPSPIARMVLTIQREFAERLSAAPRTKDYGALTLLLGRRWRVKYLRTIPASVFLPRPKVDSAVIALTPREPGELPDCDSRWFQTLVKQGFSQRRKQLGKMLGEYVSNWPEAAARLGVSETARAEELSLEQWIALTNFSRPCTTTAQEIHAEFFDIVDESDRVVGRASRHDAHTKKLLHRAVHIFVFNAAGEMFLQKRSRWKDANPSKWSTSAAGHVNAGDDYETTAAREIEEELGVTANDVRLITAIAPSRATGWEFVRLYRATHDGPFQLPSSEVESGGFFPVSVIEKWMAARPRDFAASFRECFAKYQNENRVVTKR